MATPAVERTAINRGHRTYMQRRAESSLADHPYRVELIGGLGELEWPSICANCGADTHERFTVQKVFGRPRRNVRNTGSYQRQVIRSAQIRIAARASHAIARSRRHVACSAISGTCCGLC